MALQLPRNLFRLEVEKRVRPSAKFGNSFSGCHRRHVFPKQLPNMGWRVHVASY